MQSRNSRLAPARTAANGHGDGQHFFARTVRGLEWVGAAEIASASGRIVQVSHRLLRFKSFSTPSELESLGTIDDLFVELGLVEGVGPTRIALAALGGLAEAADVSAERFDVVASFVGQRSYSRYDIEDAVGAAVQRRHGGRYLSRRATAVGSVDVSWRVHLWDDRAVIGRRVATHPLHRRPYRQETVAGSLHPPVAHALGLLAGVAVGQRVFDPCCGAGTLLIEARSQADGVAALGADIDGARIDIALRNADRAGDPLLGIVADAGQLPLASGCVDVCLANPPWGQQVPPHGALAEDRMRFWREVRRVLAPGGRIAVVQPQPLGEAERADLGLYELMQQWLRVGGAGVAVQVLAAEPGPGTEPWRGHRMGAALTEWCHRRTEVEAGLAPGRL